MTIYRIEVKTARGWMDEKAEFATRVDAENYIRTYPAWAFRIVADTEKDDSSCIGIHGETCLCDFGPCQ